MTDPVESDPEHYRLLWENDRVRVLEYTDAPGDATHPHSHPDSVMVTLSGFQREITSGDRTVAVQLDPGQARWLDAQDHHGRNVGTTSTHVLFIELKEPTGPTAPHGSSLGPSPS